MTNKEERTPYHDSTLYFDYDEVVCPICGKRIKHPYYGSVTSEQMEEDSECCLWMEVTDEGGGTIGYTPICRNIHPYTLQSENHQYIHYDLVEMVNSWDNYTLEEKVNKVIEYILHVFKSIQKKDVSVTIQDDKITNIKIDSAIDKLVITMDIDEDGNISFKS